MKNKLSQIVIMNVYKREAEGKYLKKIAEISARKYGIPVQIGFDDGSLGIWKNFCQCLTMDGGVEGTHRMIIHDDVSFERNVLEKVFYVLEQAPSDAVLGFYNPTNKDYIDCNAQGRHVLETQNNFWLQVAVYPNDLAKDFVESMDLYAKESCHDDDRLAAYLQMKDKKFYAIVPSLFQHLGAFRSNFKQGGKINNVIRNSSTYDSQVDVSKIDWKSEFANPFIGKLKKDYVKTVIREEFMDEYGKW